MNKSKINRIIKVLRILIVTIAIFNIPNVVVKATGGEIDVTASKDAWLTESGPTSNYGNATTLYACNSGADGHRINSLVSFDIDEISINDEISNATLYLWYESETGPVDAAGLKVYYSHNYRPAWVETQATWLQWATNSNWTWPGGDTDAPSPEVQATWYFTVPATTGQWIEVDVKSFIEALQQSELTFDTVDFHLWLEGNYVTSGMSYIQLSSKETGTPTHKPRLVIEYEPDGETPVYPVVTTGNYKVEPDITGYYYYVTMNATAVVAGINPELSLYYRDTDVTTTWTQSIYTGNIENGTEAQFGAYFDIANEGDQFEYYAVLTNIAGTETGQIKTFYLNQSESDDDPPSVMTLPATKNEETGTLTFRLEVMEDGDEACVVGIDYRRLGDEEWIRETDNSTTFWEDDIWGYVIMPPSIETVYEYRALVAKVSSYYEYYDTYNFVYGDILRANIGKSLVTQLSEINEKVNQFMTDIGAIIRYVLMIIVIVVATLLTNHLTGNKIITAVVGVLITTLGIVMGWIDAWIFIVIAIVVGYILYTVIKR